MSNTKEIKYCQYGGYVFKNGERQREHCDAIPSDFNADVKLFYEMAEGMGKPPRLHILLGEGNVMVGFLGTEPYLFVNYTETALAPYGISKSINKYIYKGKIDGYEFLLWFYNPRDIRLSCYLIEPDGTRWEGISGYRMGTSFSYTPPANIPFPS